MLGGTRALWLNASPHRTSFSFYRLCIQLHIGDCLVDRDVACVQAALTDCQVAARLKKAALTVEYSDEINSSTFIARLNQLVSVAKTPYPGFELLRLLLFCRVSAQSIVDFLPGLEYRFLIIHRGFLLFQFPELHDALAPSTVE